MNNELFYLSHLFDSPEPEPILRDVFEGWNTGNGIFDVLSTLADMPWKDAESVDNAVLDVAYFGNHSGGKFCAPLVKFVLNDDGVVPAAARTTLAKIIISKYLINWTKLWDTNVASYDPLHNYDVTEESVKKNANSEAESLSENQAHTGTETLTHGKTETTNHGLTNTQNVYRFGLNTQPNDPKESDRTISTDSGETSVETTGDDVNERDLADFFENSRNKVGAEQEENTLHREGNIGVTTTQKLLQEERELWIWNYFDQIFNDLDKELALAFHDPCRV